MILYSYIGEQLVASILVDVFYSFETTTPWIKEMNGSFGTMLLESESQNRLSSPTNKQTTKNTSTKPIQTKQTINQTKNIQTNHTYISKQKEILQQQQQQQAFPLGILRIKKMWTLPIGPWMLVPNLVDQMMRILEHLDRGAFGIFLQVKCWL